MLGAVGCMRLAIDLKTLPWAFWVLAEVEAELKPTRLFCAICNQFGQAPLSPSPSLPHNGRRPLLQSFQIPCAKIQLGPSQSPEMAPNAVLSLGEEPQHWLLLCWPREAEKVQEHQLCCSALGDQSQQLIH